MKIKDRYKLLNYAKEYYDRVDIKSSTVPFIDKKEIELKIAEENNENTAQNDNNTTTEV